MVVLKRSNEDDDKNSSPYDWLLSRFFFRGTLRILQISVILNSWQRDRDFFIPRTINMEEFTVFTQTVGLTTLNKRRRDANFLRSIICYTTENTFRFGPTFQQHLNLFHFRDGRGRLFKVFTLLRECSPAVSCILFHKVKCLFGENNVYLFSVEFVYL